MKKILMSLGLVGLMLTQTACSPGAFLKDVTIVVNVAETAVAAAQSAGLDPVKLAAVQKYLTAVADGNEKALAIVNSGELGAKEAADIAAAYANAIVPQTNLPPTVKAVLSLVASAVSNLIAQFGTPAAVGTRTVTVKFTRSDKMVKSSLITRNAALKAKIAALKK